MLTIHYSYFRIHLLLNSKDYMLMRQFKYCRIDGQTSYEAREEFIDSFNAPNSDKFIFLLSTRAGGLGINLQVSLRFSCSLHRCNLVRRLLTLVSRPTIRCRLPVRTH